MYHLVVNGDSIRVLDSGRERFAAKANRGTVPPGHYRISLLERFNPVTREQGPGRIGIGTLHERDVQGLIASGKCELRFGGLKFERMPTLAVPSVNGDLSIHGGADTLATTTATAPFQPLTQSANGGIRVQNADLTTLMAFLDPRLTIAQLVVLSVLPPS